MKKKLLILTFLLILPLFLKANFIGLNQGSKPMAMGGAYTALANDPTAVFWNPAGLTQLDNYQVIASHQNLFGIDNLYNEMAAVTFPFYKINWGVGWRQVNLINTYYEQIISLSVAKAFVVSGQKEIRLGFTLKNMAAVVSDDFAEADNPSTDILGIDFPGKFSADMGLQYRPNPRFGLGFILENIIEPEFEFVSESEKVKRNFRLGATYNWRDNANFVLDYEWNRDRSLWHIGAELWFFDVFAPRIGMNGEDLTVGFGIKTKKWIFDGAVLTNKNLGSTYRISFGLIFEK
ncbi:MAG: conjugal transfer protein TraF [Candidatus Cloacimonetes bacterium]|nr:conjugal transfer protein TraF [Candidatus Cloacimonadota bacterium]